MYINFNDACFLLEVSPPTLSRFIKNEGWKVINKGVEKLLKREVVEQYKQYLDTTYSRNQIHAMLKEQGKGISLRTLYVRFRENRRYTLEEIEARLGI